MAAQPFLAFDALKLASASDATCRRLRGSHPLGGEGDDAADRRDTDGDAGRGANDGAV